MVQNWTQKILRLRKDARVFYFAARHPRTPWYAKAAILLVAAYAVSPVDIIPDFIPLAGYLDDLVIIPAGIYLAMRLVPRDIIEEAEQKSVSPEKESRRWGLLTVAIIGFLFLMGFGIILLIRALL